MSSVSGWQQGDPSGSFSEPETGTGADPPPMGTRGARQAPAAAGWHPGLPCGLQDGLGARLRLVPQPHPDVSTGGPG